MEDTHKHITLVIFGLAMFGSLFNCVVEGTGNRLMFSNPPLYRSDFETCSSPNPAIGQTRAEEAEERR